MDTAVFFKSSRRLTLWIVVPFFLNLALWSIGFYIGAESESSVAMHRKAQNLLTEVILMERKSSAHIVEFVVNKPDSLSLMGYVQEWLRGATYSTGVTWEGITDKRSKKKNILKFSFDVSGHLEEIRAFLTKTQDDTTLLIPVDFDLFMKENVEGERPVYNLSVSAEYHLIDGSRK